MSRAKWKGSFIAKHLLRKNTYKFDKIKIWSRNSVIPFFLIDKTVIVHNGKIFKKLYISREKVGFKFGEFIFTKIRPKAKILKKKK